MAPALSDGELVALRSLGEKTSDSAVSFVNIRDARALTEMGLAVRSREGWTITSEGLARLALEPAADAPSHRRLLHEVFPAPAPASPDQVRPLLVERWIHLRTLLLRQLEPFESGSLQLVCGGADVTLGAIEQLKAEIRDFDALIVAE